MNMNREKTYKNVRIQLNRSGVIEEWDCQTGAQSVIAQADIITSFPPVGEHLYVVQNEPSNAPMLEGFHERKVTQLQNRLAYTLQEPNVCVLDFAAFRIDDGEWQKEIEILKVDQAVREHFGLPHRGGEMIQPWYAKKKQVQRDVLGNVALRFEFEMSQLPKGEIELVIEDPRWFQIRWNDTPISVDSELDRWIDVSMKRVKVPKGSSKQGKIQSSYKLIFMSSLVLKPFI